MFNTLRYAKMLEEVGFSREQAETSIKILAEIMEDKLATKQDLKDLEMRIDRRFTEIEAKFPLLESRLTVKMGTMMAAAIAILATIQKFVH